MRVAPTAAMLFLCAGTLVAQTPPVNLNTSYEAVANPTFQVPTDLTYKVAWNVAQGSPKPGDANEAFRVIARFVHSHATTGVPTQQMQVAVVVHGSAGAELLSNAAYRTRTDLDNPNIALLEELSKAGVRFIICGQTVANRKLPREQLLPFVQVSLSAAWAFAVLQAQGYHVNPF